MTNHQVCPRNIPYRERAFPVKLRNHFFCEPFGRKHLDLNPRLFKKCVFPSLDTSPCEIFLSSVSSANQQRPKTNRLTSVCTRKVSDMTENESPDVMRSKSLNQ